MQTKLGKRLAATAVSPATSKAEAPARSRLAAVLEQGLRGELVDLPLLGPAWIELLGPDEQSDVEAEVQRAMDARELRFSAVTVIRWESERAKRTLARAVRDASDHTVRFGTVDEWGKLDEGALTACWHAYGDVVERLDPMGSSAVSDARKAEIRAAWKKKDTTLLRSFGVAELSIFLASTECPPDTSPTQTSSGGDSSSAS